MNQKLIKRNFKMYSLTMSLLGFAPHTLIAVLYFEQLLNSYTLAMSVFSLTFLSASFSEIPLGIMSDFIGRKKTLILGSFAYFLGLFFYILPTLFDIDWSVFTFLACGGISQGISMALFSGTDEAMIYESAELLGAKDDYKKYFSKGRSLNQLSLAVSAGLSGFVAYYFGYEYCFYISMVSMTILFLLSFFWTEVGYNTRDGQDKGNNVFAHTLGAFKLFRKNKRLRYLAAACILEDSSELVNHRFEVIFFKTLIPDYLLGIQRMFKQFGGAISYHFASRIIDKLTPIKTLIASCWGTMVVRFLGLSINNLISPWILSLTNIFHGTTRTSETELLQKEFSPKQRATMRSLVGMGATLMFSILSILIGALADLTSVREAIMYFLVIKVIMLLLYSKVEKMSKED